MKSTRSFSATFSFVFGALLCGSLSAQNVLMIDAPPDPSWSTDVISKISAAGFSGTITEFNGGLGTLTLSQMQAYDAVFVYSDAGFADPTTLGNNLAAYVNGGGGVVIATFSNASEPIGGLWSSGGYDPILPLSQTQGTELTLGTIFAPGDPLLQGVTSFDGGSSSYHGTGVVNPNSQLIANWSNGDPLLARSTAFAGKIDSLNFYPVSSDARSDFWLAGTDGGLIMANALRDVSRASSAVPEPSSLALLGLGGLGLAISAYRRRRAATAA